MAGGPVSGDVSGDHDLACGDPALTQRTVHAGTDDMFYPCNAHVMTAINTEGYDINWFSPKQAFFNVSQVCFAQNLTNLGGGKWTQVVFLTPDEYEGQDNLGFTSPEFPNDQLADASDRPPDGPETQPGAAHNGVKIINGSDAETWAVPADANANNHHWYEMFNQFVDGSIMRMFFWGGMPSAPSKADRYHICITDNGDGTSGFQVMNPDGSVLRTGNRVDWSIPDGPVRVVFEDDNYNPDKHNDGSTTGIPHGTGQGYTWHWDDVQITEG